MISLADLSNITSYDQIGVVRPSHLTDEPQPFFITNAFLSELKNVIALNTTCWVIREEGCWPRKYAVLQPVGLKKFIFVGLAYVDATADLVGTLAFIDVPAERPGRRARWVQRPTLVSGCIEGVLREVWVQ